MPETFSLSTTQEVRAGGLPCAAFNQLALREGLSRAAGSFPATELTLAELSVFAQVVFAENVRGAAAVLLRPEPGEFSGLTTDEANAWLDGRGVAERVCRGVCLAELFAVAGGRPLAARSGVGFKPVG